jgi:hypothetical protein
MILGLATAAIFNVAGIFVVSSTTSGPSLNLELPALLGAFFGVAVVLSLAQILLFRSGFRTLAEVTQEFSTPSTLALVALFGVVIATAGLGLLLVAVFQAIQCTGGGPLTSACFPAGPLFGGIALLGVGAVAALVGLIGILIGIWRLGERFGSSLLKAAAILLIIPYLSVVGDILILVAATQEIDRIERV